MSTLAQRLGTTPHLSPLLRKARRLGLLIPRDLETLAVQRGCLHYQRGDEPVGELATKENFSNEELSVALLNVALPYDPHSIRCGAAMLGTDGNDVSTLARLAAEERSVLVVRHVAESGARFEPSDPFWRALLAALPPTPPPNDGVLPHPTRFIAMTGMDRGGQRGLRTQWLRPRPRPFAACSTPSAF